MPPKRSARTYGRKAASKAPLSDLTSSVTSAAASASNRDPFSRYTGKEGGFEGLSRRGRNREMEWDEIVGGGDSNDGENDGSNSNGGSVVGLNNDVAFKPQVSASLDSFSRARPNLTISTSVSASLSIPPACLSSRKRGACGTPVEVVQGAEKWRSQNIEGLSPENASPGSAGLIQAFQEAGEAASRVDQGRERSRSRILSPEHDVSPRALPRHRSGASSGELSDDPCLPLPPAVRSRSLPSPAFSMEPTPPATPLEALLAHPSTTLADVRWSCKVMKGEMKKLKKLGIASQPAIQIVPPTAWDKEAPGRKNTFIVWATCPQLGFTLRSAGGGIVFLQLPSSKVTATFDLLERLFHALKAPPPAAAAAGGSPSPLRFRAATFPLRQTPPLPAPMDVDVDTVADDLAKMNVDGHGMSQVAVGAKPKKKAPRPSYSPTPTHNVNMAIGSDYFDRRRTRRDSRDSFPCAIPPPLMACDGSPPFALPAPTAAISPKLPAVGSAPNPTAFANPASAHAKQVTSFSTETPMIKKGYWGSQPLSNGGDWGGSMQATKRTIAKLKDFLAGEADAVFETDTAKPAAARYSGAFSRSGGDEVRPEERTSRTTHDHPLASSSTTLPFDFEVEEEDGYEPSLAPLANTTADSVGVLAGGLRSRDSEVSNLDSEFGDRFDGDGFDEDEDAFDTLPPIGGGYESITAAAPALPRGVSMGRRRSSMLRRESVGASALGGLTLDSRALADEDDFESMGAIGGDKQDAERKKRQSMAKLRRVSMCAVAMDRANDAPQGRLSTFASRLSVAGNAGRPSLLAGAGGLLRNRMSSTSGMKMTSLTGRLGGATRVAIENAAEDGFKVPMRMQMGVAQKDASALVTAAVAPSTPLSVEALNKNLPLILSFLDQEKLLTTSCLVNSHWWTESVSRQAALMLESVGCEGMAGGKSSGSSREADSDSDGEFDESDDEQEEKKTEVGAAIVAPSTSIVDSMKRSWKFLHEQYPHASFLSEGAFKQVYRVYNVNTGGQEAISVMDLDLISSTGNSQVVGAELAVSVLLSSMVRLGSCPNFIATRRAFTCDFAPPASHWGDERNKAPRGKLFNSRGRNPPPRQPSKGKGRFQYITMELCKHGDIESYLQRQVGKVVSSFEARGMLFQMAFSLYASKAKFGLKHYDIKNLNFLLQDADVEGGDHTHVALKYGYKGKVFSVKMKRERAVIAKLADYGTADLRADTEVLPISMANFTTLENTPPEFLILGEKCCQGWGHDNWGLGLSMFHLMTGNCPYEEILEDVVCPPGLRRALSGVWEEKGGNFGVVESLINAEVYEEGDEKDFTLFDTLYRYLVLFGTWGREVRFGGEDGRKVWDAIGAGLRADAVTYAEDVSKFGFETGNNYIIGGARERLAEVPGAMDCLKGLLTWDPAERWTAEDVLDCEMMHTLFKENGDEVGCLSTQFMNFFDAKDE